MVLIHPSFPFSRGIFHIPLILVRVLGFSKSGKRGQEGGKQARGGGRRENVPGKGARGLGLELCGVRPGNTGGWRGKIEGGAVEKGLKGRGRENKLFRCTNFTS